ncbi:hypothetical protein LY76DRAFT_586236 [Colletotrichum caudatum]|nr:hypothetical protein LY76DRAFT_586236 [Colletotrichum caudatum]
MFCLPPSFVSFSLSSIILALSSYLDLHDYQGIRDPFYILFLFIYSTFKISIHSSCVPTGSNATATTTSTTTPVT